MALPLQAEDSDVFESPLLAKLAQEPPPGELAVRAEVERPQLDGHDDLEEIEVIEDRGHERSHHTPVLSEPVPVAQRRAATHPGTRAATHPGTRAGTHPGGPGRAPSQAEPMTMSRAETATELATPGHRPTRWWIVGVVFLLIIAVLAGTVYLLGLFPSVAAG
jgi:cobalamin biosynthesis Mg chelatase CobN